ncbi:hypothetical protein Y1Q_0024674 [Alligator mississippiensis]|uniref:Uncharacterized protein n=1 Tax=Alligator mississippiensis TaxID=8496 RepID=A0A151PH71_ALLMI|nr:hypothetical protein Y1Q_0024674 [Alligator mississippiensis]
MNLPCYPYEKTGEEATEVYSNFTFAPSQNMNFNEIVNKFEECCAPKCNETLREIHFVCACKNQMKAKSTISQS